MRCFAVKEKLGVLQTYWIRVNKRNPVCDGWLFIEGGI